MNEIVLQLPTSFVTMTLIWKDVPNVHVFIQFSVEIDKIKNRGILLRF